MPVMVDSEGKYVSFTPTAPVAAGAIVALRELVGIAPVAIAAGSVGQIAVRGIVRVPVTHTKATQHRHRRRHQTLMGHPRWQRRPRAVLRRVRTRHHLVPQQGRHQRRTHDRQHSEQRGGPASGWPHVQHSPRRSEPLTVDITALREVFVKERNA